MAGDFYKKYVSAVLDEAAENPALGLALQLNSLSYDSDGLRQANLGKDDIRRASDIATACENPEGDLALLAAARDIMAGKVPAEYSGTMFHNLTSNLLSAGFNPDSEFSRPAVELIRRIVPAAG